MIGILAGKYHNSSGILNEPLKTISQIDPNGLIIIFLPILTFKNGFTADWHVFKRIFG